MNGAVRIAFDFGLCRVGIKANIENSWFRASSSSAYPTTCAVGGVAVELVATNSAARISHRSIFTAEFGHVDLISRDVDS